MIEFDVRLGGDGDLIAFITDRAERALSITAGLTKQ